MANILYETVPIKVVFGIVIVLLSVAFFMFYLFLKSNKNKNKIETITKKSPSKTDFPIHTDVHGWMENSKKALLQIDHLSQNEINALKDEVAKRQLMYSTYTSNPVISNNTIENLQGTYHIIGFNQNEEKSRYSGFLHLKQTGNHRVHAEWVIGGEQTQVGTGFYNNNILVINFSYEGDAYKIYKGVVVYKVLNQSILNGFWSEKHASDSWLGIEEGRKLADTETITNLATLN
ncbi:hypothetical protein [Maribacter sp. MAR_2009_72]|uniref:hypothetical protein n=1 Tax=Maribacter sp. MAR_2009_72 TaxID=1250050 RepID=UPI0011994965|nr:hypothetical protein [Maribacter sp. MAR_2009_72]TVZ14465.1 hypothetical protein JM81_0669 [Maribacter sp. MAR_2009_72]